MNGQSRSIAWIKDEAVGVEFAKVMLGHDHGFRSPTRVHASGQRYRFIRTQGGNSVVRYESTDSDFTAVITFDRGRFGAELPGHRPQAP